MNIVDIVIILVLLMYIAKGFSNGILKEGITFVGGIAVIVIAFLFKNPLSVIMYQNLPFFRFSGVLAGISVLNIIIYEIIAFLTIASILIILYDLLLKVTNIVERIVKKIFIFDIPSKILGAVLGAVEGVVITFIILFICIQFDMTRPYINESKFAEPILTKTPFMGDAIAPTYNALKEIYTLADEYRDSDRRAELNLKCFDVLLKDKIITPSNGQLLIDNGKLKMKGAQEVVDKYKQGE